MIWFFSVGALALLGIDQFTKWLTIRFIMPVSTVPIIKNVFHLTYIENAGAAFGIMQNKTWLFVVITVLFLAAVLGYFIKRKPQSKLMVCALTLLTGGALGNFIDRIFRGYVVDMLDFRLIHFAVFNMADVFVVAGALLLAYYLIFVEGRKKPVAYQTADVISTYIYRKDEQEQPQEQKEQTDDE